MQAWVTDSPLRCPYDGKRMVMHLGESEAENDGGHEARHECLHCGYAEVETGRTVPVASTTGPSLAQIRDRIRDDAMDKPATFLWPELEAVDAKGRTEQDRRDEQRVAALDEYLDDRDGR